jgi:hypothetical protein
VLSFHHMNPNNNAEGNEVVMPAEANGAPRTMGRLNQVTPVSKVLAAIIFIMMPFLGAYVGYVYAPEKVVEVEKVVMVQPEVISEDATADTVVQEIADASTTTLETFSHPSDGYSLNYDPAVYEIKTISSSEFIPSFGFIPSAEVISDGGYVQSAVIHTYKGNSIAAQNAYIEMYEENFNPEILKNEELTIDGFPARVITISTDVGSSGWAVYFIEASNSKTIVASGDTTITTAIKLK